MFPNMRVLLGKPPVSLGIPPCIVHLRHTLGLILPCMVQWHPRHTLGFGGTRAVLVSNPSLVEMLIEIDVQVQCSVPSRPDPPRGTT